MGIDGALRCAALAEAEAPHAGALACGMALWSPPCLGQLDVSGLGGRRNGVVRAESPNTSPAASRPLGHDVQMSPGSSDCPCFGHPCPGFKGAAKEIVPQAEGGALAAGNSR